MFCRKHKIKYGWTCPVCEARWLYSGRSHLIEFFDAGVKNDLPKDSMDSQQQAAYEHGRQHGETRLQKCEVAVEAHLN